MKLFNTKTRNLEEFKSINANKVTLYTCGPTVYDRLHVGNWVAYIRWDELVRALRLDGYDVDRVMNITDVGHLVSDADEGEDKLVKGAEREGKSAWKIADEYTQDFLSGVKELNLVEPTHYAMATKHIDDMIDLIKKLEDKGYTYVISDGVYYDTSKFPAYAEFAGLDLDDQKEGARVKANPEKRNPSDFALWKFSPTGSRRDMEWDSPWGKGFPGWHIECSAMAMKYLGETIDIHTGGIDHIPVHHTNEIAQSEAANGKPLANFWLHNAHLLVDGTKISKSLSNGMTLSDLEQKGFSPMDFRIFVLQSHYRTESNFTWDNLKSAKNRLKVYEAMADLKWQSVEGESITDFEAEKNKIRCALDDDLNTPLALSALSELADRIISGPLTSGDKDSFQGYLDFLDASLGLELGKRPDISDSCKNLISEREHAREAKDWPKADELRKELEKNQLEINDTNLRAVWRRVG